MGIREWRSIPNDQFRHDRRRPSQRAIVGKGWVQGVALVFILGFLVMGFLVYRTYTASMPVPDKVVTSPVRCVHRRRHHRGQELFQARGLHGVRVRASAMGPTWARTTPPTTCAGRRRRRRQFRAQGVGDPRAARGRGLPDQPLRPRHQRRWSSPPSRPPRSTASRATTPGSSAETIEIGLLPEADHRPDGDPPPDRVLRLDGLGVRRRAAGARLLLHQQLAARAARGQRPDRRQLVVWTVLSLIALLGGIGLLFAVFGRWNVLGWHGASSGRCRFRQPGEVALTPAQRATRLVLPGHGGAVLGADAAGCRRRSTTAPT